MRERKLFKSLTFSVEFNLADGGAFGKYAMTLKESVFGDALNLN